MDDEHVLLHRNHYSTMSQQPPRSQQDLMAHLDRLKFFLATAPSRWSAPNVAPTSHHHPALNRFLLPSGEYVTCVLWSGLYHITGTDIVRALVFRFEAFGRPVRNMKKFEEGVFSDLRNLKPGHDACLEEPKSPFLDLLFKYQCIRTQKKQKVFYWFSVPHDRLFLDALERDLKREKMGQEPTTAVIAEPAASFSYDPKRSLYEQFSAKPAPVESEGNLSRVVRQGQTESPATSVSASNSSVSLPELEYGSSASLDSSNVIAEPPTPPPPRNPLARTPFFNMFSLFEGSPTYKQRRKKVPKARRSFGDREQPLQAPASAHHFLAGPGQFGIASMRTGYTSPAHVAGLVHMRHPAPERPSEHAERDQERALVQMQDREEVMPEMDVDGGGSPASQYVPEGPVTPQYPYEDEQAYGSGAATVRWVQHPTAPGESSAYGTAGVPPPSPGYHVRGTAYESASDSRESIDALPDALTAVSVATSNAYYTAGHQHPLSAPSHRVTFDESYPAAVGAARRPRSVTPSLPARAPYVRRPSTANEAPSTYDAAPSWRTQAARGYHPYAPRTASAYSSSGSSPTPSTLAMQQEYDASPFAYMVGAETYPMEQTYEGAAYRGASPDSGAVYRPLSPESPGEVEQPRQYAYAPAPAPAAYAAAPHPADAAPMYQIVPQDRYYEQRVV